MNYVWEVVFNIAGQVKLAPLKTAFFNDTVCSFCDKLVYKNLNENIFFA
jgi:hypothetical protein